MPFQPSSQSRAASVGSAAGKGIGNAVQEGLDFLAQQKMLNLQRSKLSEDRHEFSQLLQKTGNYTPEVADVMAHIYQNNPKAFQEYFGQFQTKSPAEDIEQQNPSQYGLSALGGQNMPQFGTPQALQESQLRQLLQTGGMNQQQPEHPMLRPEGQPQGFGELNNPLEQLRRVAGLPSNRQQALEREIPLEEEQFQAPIEKKAAKAFQPLLREGGIPGAVGGEKPLTAQQKITKIKDDRKDAALFNNIYKIATEMNDLLDSGKVDLGRYSDILYKISPHKVSEETSRYAKLATKLAQLQAGTEKGVVGKYRLERIEAAKPSLLDTLESNKEDLSDIIAQSRDNLEYIHENNPEAGIKLPEFAPEQTKSKQTGNTQNDELADLESQHPASKVKEGYIARDEDGVPKFIKLNGEWEHYNG